MKPINSRDIVLTINDSPSIHQYFNEINKFKVLSREEEDSLFREYIISKDKQLFDKIVNSNLRFVVSVAKRYHSQNKDLLLNDLINEGNIGLIKAVDKFNPDSGNRFLSFAVFQISRFILEYIYSMKLVNIPYNHYTIKSKVDRFVNKCESLNGYSPSLTEISEHLEIDEFTISNALVGAKIVKTKGIDRWNESEVDIVDTISSDYNNIEEFIENDYYTTKINEYVINSKVLKPDEKETLMRHFNLLPKNKDDSFIEKTYSLPVNIDKIILKIKKRNNIKKYDRIK